MKKYLILSLIYTCLGLLFGVYFREATKMLAFNGATMLRVIHPHLIILGGVFNLFMFFFSRKYEFKNTVLENIFFYSYNVGLSLTVIMMSVRGSFEVFGVSLNGGMNGMKSGIAGIGHIVLTISIILFFVLLFKDFKEEKVKIDL